MTDLLTLRSPAGTTVSGGSLRFRTVPFEGALLTPAFDLFPSAHRQNIEFTFPIRFFFTPWVPASARGVDFLRTSFAKRLDHLLTLPPNWDSYGAHRLNPSVVESAIAFFRALEMVIEIEPPQVVPAPHGGLQFEWHGQEIDIEIEFGPDGIACVWIAERSLGGETEGSLEAHLPKLLRALTNFRGK